ncbi:MAG TPA: hypothetical protein VG651_12515 [Stellaceae bacterium]|nr:hypothetical protein [Stellaceae bacterium]
MSDERITLDFAGTRLLGLTAEMRELQQRFSGTEVRLGSLETRFSGLESRFAGLEARFDGMERRMAVLEERITHLISLVVRIAERQGVRE